MAGSSRALTKSLSVSAGLAVLLFFPAQHPSAAAASQWFAASIHDGKAFPVLLPADGKWLNWRDTYGAPRMRLEPDGVWRQVGVHQGIDIFAEQGTPVVSIGNGTVENAGWTFYSGWRVGIRGDDGRYYFYAHLLQDLAPGVSPGARVRPGTRLGSLGSSGYGPEGTKDEFPAHLHFGLQTRGGDWINPQAMLKDLYDKTVGRVRDLRARLAQLEQARRLALAGAHSSVSGLQPLNQEHITRLREEAAQTRAELETVGP